MQKQISSWRKELSIITETKTGSDNGKLNRKKRKIYKKYRVTNTREVAQLTETLKQKVQAKVQRIRSMKKGKPSIVRIRCFSFHFIYFQSMDPYRITKSIWVWK